MFDWLKKKPQTPPPAVISHPLRELLFGDQPLDQWCGSTAAEPWAHFRHAVELIKLEDRTGARKELSSIVAMLDLESRHYLQAWRGLRRLGVAPPTDQAKRVLGVVVDVPVAGKLDSLAAYEDGTARYLNRDGGAVIWEVRGPQPDPRVESVIAAGRVLVRQIGPWVGLRPALPAGQARISLLTPSGLHFGQGPFEILSRDAKAAPVFKVATELMQSLVKRAIDGNQKTA